MIILVMIRHKRRINVMLSQYSLDSHSNSLDIDYAGPLRVWNDHDHSPDSDLCSTLLLNKAEQANLFS